MAGKLNVEIRDEDWKQLQKNIDLFNVKSTKALEKGVLDGAEIVAEDIKNDIRNRAKHQTGKLESSVGARIFSSKPGYVNADAGYVNTDPAIWSKREDRYFVYWEIGTSKQEPRHSALKAKRKMKGEVAKEVEASIFELLNGISFN